MAIIKSPIFKDITESEISEMTAAGFLRARKFRKNSFIYHVTDSVHEIGIVASGQVIQLNIQICGGNKAIMSNITSGHVFAETYALTGEPLMVDAVASETSVILFLDMDKLMNSQFENTHCKDTILNNLLHISIQKNLTLSNRIFCTSPKTIRERLLIYLSNESRKGLAVRNS
ncbi:MAG: Crp/Fnr family transcriptional regulator [Lachnospira eligens]